MLNPDLAPFLREWDAQWARLPPDATPQARRAHFEAIARAMRLETPEDIETGVEHWIDSEAGGVRIRVFRHRDGGVQPALVYMHGGAWMQGSPETHWDITARIASWNRQTVLSVDYALAPEHPYPAAFRQCVDVVRWARENAASLGIDPARLAIGGDSAGANLAAAVALKCRDEDLPLCAQLLIYMPSDFSLDWPSCQENADGPLLKVAGMAATRAMYCPDPAIAATDPFAVPLVARSHAGLPPAFVAVAQFDPLRDSGLAYADALEAAGVAVTRDPGKGLIHGYLRAMGYCAAARASLQDMCRWLAAQGAR